MKTSLHSFLVIVTDIGDSACLLALIAAAGIYLKSRGSGRAALFLAAAFLLSATLIGLLKLAFLGCHSHFHLSDVHSPSGHAALSAAVFWAFSTLMRSQLEAWRRFLPLAATTALIALIALSRVWLGYHTATEACIGVLTGYIALIIAKFLIVRKHGLAPFDAYALALWGVVAIFIVHGSHLPAEDWIRRLVPHVRGHIPFCKQG